MLYITASHLKCIIKMNKNVELVTNIQSYIMLYITASHLNCIIKMNKNVELICLSNPQYQVLVQDIISKP